MSLKELFENGIKFLNYGGKIVHSVIRTADYYDLYKSDGSEELLLCDGESVDFEKKYHISIGLPYWYGVTDNGKEIYLTNDEYRIAVFQ